MIPLTDTSLMPQGKYRGYKMANVPHEHLIYIYENFTLKPPLKKYIEDRIGDLRIEVKLANKARLR